MPLSQPPLLKLLGRQGLSKKYLEILARDLVAGGLVRSASGKGGGYKLCRKPEEYSIGEIIELMEGSLSTVACLADGAEPCPRAAACKTLPLWAEYDKLTHDFFYSKSIQELIQK